MRKYKTIENMNDEMLIKAYYELKLSSLPKDGIIRGLQSKLSHEKGSTVTLSHVQYQIALENVERLLKKEETK